MKRRTYSDYLKAYKNSKLMSNRVIRGMEYQFNKHYSKRVLIAR